MPGMKRTVSRTIYSNSGATSANGATDNLKSSTTFGRWPNSVEAVTLTLKSTDLTGTLGANSAFVHLEHSPDGGTTWLLAERFGQITTSTGENTIHFRTNGIGANEAAAQTTGLQSGTASVSQNIVLAEDVRLRWTMGTGSSLTFGVYAVFQQHGSRGSY